MVWDQKIAHPLRPEAPLPAFFMSGIYAAGVKAPTELALPNFKIHYEAKIQFEAKAK